MSWIQSVSNFLLGEYRVRTTKLGDNSLIQHVRLTDDDGNIVSPGAGTQYTEGDTDASITGTAVMWEDSGNTLKPVSAANPLPISGTLTTTGGALAGDGRKTCTTSGTAEALASDTTCVRVIVTAEEDNTGMVVVGGSTVVAALATRRGIPLAPGQRVEINAANLDEVFIDAMVNGDGVTYAYEA